ncbi:lytic polysaccharide monooxygenase [Annulohypoxylon truncatum]|uniref:lytic polysaccharide monooxygenase n=1 Tax=Annulohypoxylon truncatum TaxID=327061 RepID=UPI002007D849|nr:lytic polysaccharide monooxygenase [Annulohypoxylon truncatum]KAI1214966.1 lytic polysaccharide monooxygenase [Annulohypoxylon truncatum]
MQSSTIFTLAGLAALVNGHMKMKSPAPFDPSALNNSPLDASGSDFPCKFGSGYSATGGTTNTFALGSKQTLSFVGQATHGGGSCQVSITYDTTPTKDSKWKVIHSIEGGCPAKGVSGNMGDSADADDPFTYPYTIPSNIPAGKATIAWTWFNKVGNREMYMNCGALELTGTGGSQSDFDALPDMLVMNIAGKPTTLEGYDYAFADPGSSVEDNTSAGTVATCGTSGCTVGKSSSSGSGSSGSGSSAASSAAAATSAAASSAAAPASSAASSAGAGGVFITQSPSAAAPTSAAAAPTSAAASSAATSAAAATPTASAGSGSSTSSGSVLTGACSPEGTFNCMGSTYQQCASGQWSVAMQMASGTTCSAGQGTTLNIAAIGKRMVRFFKA